MLAADGSEPRLDPRRHVERLAVDAFTIVVVDGEERVVDYFCR